MSKIRQCTKCQTTETSKWYSGPTCLKCYSQARHKRIYKANPEFYKQRSKEWRAKYPDRSKSSNLAKFGINLDRYQQMYESQEGKCAICKSTKFGRAGISYFSVDHCHKTGKVRGLLCSYCNTALGQMDDSIDRLKSAIEYLTKNQSE